nr:hypothetical protein [Candidatus Sigynarchaeota archaeon]
KHRPDLIKKVFTPKRIEEILTCRLESFKTDETDYIWDRESITGVFSELIGIYQEEYPGGIQRYHGLGDLVEYLFYLFSSPRDQEFADFAEYLENICPGCISRIFNYKIFKDTIFGNYHILRDVFQGKDDVNEGANVDYLKKIIVKYGTKEDVVDFIRICDDFQALGVKFEILYQNKPILEGG